MFWRVRVYIRNSNEDNSSPNQLQNYKLRGFCPFFLFSFYDLEE